MTSAVVNGPKYTPADRALRIAYVQEYLKDYDAYSACIRLGFEGDDVIMAQAKELADDVLVNQLIAETNENRSESYTTKNPEELINPDFKPETVDIDKQRIMSGLFHEAFFKGKGSSHSARITALTTLARVYQMDKPEESPQTVSSNVMIVPAMGGVDAWEKQSIGQQTELKNTVRE